MVDRLEHFKRQRAVGWFRGFDKDLDEILEWFPVEVERLRTSHNTMTVDCQTQGCREKLNHELMDKQEAEIKRLRAFNNALMARATRFAEDCINKDTTIATLREAVENKEVEWAAGPCRNKCPWCGGLHPDHRSDCERQETLK